MCSLVCACAAYSLPNKKTREEIIIVRRLDHSSCNFECRLFSFVSRSPDSIVRPLTMFIIGSRGAFPFSCLLRASHPVSRSLAKEVPSFLRETCECIQKNFNFHWKFIIDYKFPSAHIGARASRTSEIAARQRIAKWHGARALNSIYVVHIECHMYGN